MRLLLIFIFLPIAANAQHIGIKVFGANSFSNNIESSRYSASGGVFVQKDWTKFSFRSELLFRLDGFSNLHFFEPEKDSNGDTIRFLGLRTVDYQFNYIEIPFILNYKIGNKIKPYFGIGSSFKFGVFSKRRLNIEYRSKEYDPINSSGFDITGIANIGVESKINDCVFHIEARYNHGFFNIFDNRKIYSVSFLIGFSI